MKKLIKVINSKIIQKKKKTGNNPIKTDKDFLNFIFRRDKLNQKITLKSFKNYQDYSNNCLLATCNFQGTQFIIRQKNQVSEEKDSIQLEQNSSIFEKEGKESKPIISSQLLQKVIFCQDKVNDTIGKLYCHKKRLLEEPDLQFNINFILATLVGFVIGLVIFTRVPEGSNQSKQDSQDNIGQKYPQVFFGFILVLSKEIFQIKVVAGLANFLWALFKSYEFFNFDYEVIKKVTQKLIKQNQTYFNRKNYTLVCDIQTTWILLRPLNTDPGKSQIN